MIPHYTDVAKKKNRSAQIFALFLLCAIIIGVRSLPSQWSGNEVNYFDLSQHYLHPELFGPNHSVYDGSNARFLSFTIIGNLIDLFGFENTKLILSLTSWMLLASGLAFLATSLGMGLAPTGIALTLFVLFSRQSPLGGEWIFGTIEAKTFAYTAIFWGLGTAFRNRWPTTIGLMALATYFHFLVGGFWALAIVLLFFFRTRKLAGTGAVLGAYTILILPILFILVKERLGGVTDSETLDIGINEIYAVFRAPHHLAPFSNWRDFLRDWFPGLTVHIGLVVIFILLRRLKGNVPSELPTLMVALNLYIVLAILIAYADRNTHAFAPFYLFRPSSLIWLLSIMALAMHVGEEISKPNRNLISVVIVILVLSLTLPQSLMSMAKFGVKRVTAYESLPEDERALVTWIQENTSSDSALLMEPVEEGSMPLVAFERLTGRGFIVNYKFVPTLKADLVRWYQLFQARSALFDGECSQIEFLDADYIIVQSAEVLERIQPCGKMVFGVGRYSVIKV